MKIYVYDTTTDNTPIDRILATLFGQRYMALIDKPWPHGRIAGYGYTPARAARRARRNAGTVRRDVADALVATYDDEQGLP